MDLAAALMTFFVFGGLFCVTRPLVQALAERIRHRGEPAAADVGDDVLEEFRAMRHGMAELAERVGFAEPVLAKQRDAARLPG
jgi:hypothetical protein